MDARPARRRASGCSPPLVAAPETMLIVMIILQQD
jgi:hypothetical protein